MKKILFSILALMFIASACFATTSDWRRGTNSMVELSGDNPGVNTTSLDNYSTLPLDQLLPHYIWGCNLSYTSTTTVTVSAGELSFGNTANHLMRQNTSTTTVNLGSSGVGGLDTGTVAASSLYYIYADADATGPTFTAIASLSSTAPTGVTNYRLISCVITDTNGYIINFVQNGNHFVYADVYSNSNLLLLNLTTQTSFTAVSCSAIVPMGTVFVDLNTYTNSPQIVNLRATGSNATNGIQYLYAPTNGNFLVYNIPVNASRSFDYKVGNGEISLYLMGYTVSWR